jgi:lysophospholipase L1-like esterase
MRLLVFILLPLAFLGAAHSQSPAPPAPPGLEHGNVRIILVGDSITGQSRNHPAGFAHQIDWALKRVYPGCHPEVVALGGSGAGVQAWLNFEARSRTVPVFLDVKGIDVKTTLEQPADVLIVMLGINDVLAPYVTDDPASLEQWTAHYRELLSILKERLKPGVIACATATLCTEDEASPKNRMMAALNNRLAEVARERGAIVLPTHETMREVLQRGRRLQPDFHVTGDYVHPNEAGHLAIAMAMLRGLGEAAAARALEEEKLAPFLQRVAGPPPTLSYEVRPLVAAPESDRQSFRVHYWLSTGNGTGRPPVPVTLAGAGWEIAPAAPETGAGGSSHPGSSARSAPGSWEGAEGEFTATGVPDRLENHLELRAAFNGHPVTRDIRIPAPWLTATGVIRPSWSVPPKPGHFHGPREEAIELGRDFLADPKPPLVWKRYFADVNFTGSDAPGSVDFAALAHARNFEGGYAVRWIHSDRDRSVTLQASTQTFAATLHLTLWLNGLSLYDGILTAEPGKKTSFPAQLRTGWNALVLNLDHTAWQWQCAVQVEPVGDDSLEDLRYSVTRDHHRD